MHRAFGDHYIYAGLGTSITLGASPHQIGNTGLRPAADMARSDLRSYQAILSNHSLQD